MIYLEKKYFFYGHFILKNNSFSAITKENQDYEIQHKKWDNHSFHPSCLM